MGPLSATRLISVDIYSLIQTFGLHAPSVFTNNTDFTAHALIKVLLYLMFKRILDKQNCELSFFYMKL